jgi:hypothetical protein
MANECAEVEQKTVTHKIVPIKEKHHEVTENHGITTNQPISVDDFKGKLSGETVQSKAVYDGVPTVDGKDVKGHHVDAKGL